jgi:hypothetical protein
MRFVALMLLVGCSASSTPADDLGLSSADLGMVDQSHSPTVDDLSTADLAHSGSLRPNPRLSRNRPVTSSAGDSTIIDGLAQPLSSINDGAFNCCDGFRSATPAWVAIDLGSGLGSGPASGPTRVLVTWLAHGQPDAPQNQPIDYRIEVSPDGTSWTTKASVTGNDTTAREDVVDFTGQRFVRIAVDKADGDVVELVELEVYDVSNGSDDTWVFLGDSITAMSMNPPMFSDLIAQAKPGYTPMMIGAAIGGTQTVYALDHIDAWIARYPDIRNFAVAYGTNDAGCDSTGEGAPAYLSRLKTLVDKLKAAGKTVLIPHIPWNEYCSNTPTLLAPYNDGIDMLRAQDPFVAGPDLYTWFANHQDQLGPDHVHPSDDGVTSINQLWATAAQALY